MKQSFYAVFWTLLTILVVGGLLALAFIARFGATQRTISPESFTPPPSVESTQPSATPSAHEVENLPDVEVKETDIVVSSTDGLMQLRLHSKLASSADGVVELPEAELEFFFEGGRKLYVLARDLRYQMQEETAIVEGELSGEIPSLRERFTARGFTWERNSGTITLKKATLIDPGFRTEARDITLDVRNDILEILGNVEVAI